MQLTSFLDAFRCAPERPAERHHRLADLTSARRRHDGLVVAIVAVVLTKDAVVAQDRGAQGSELRLVQDDLVMIDRVD